MEKVRTQWYKNAVVYQIYPFSYQDSNNDGYGDIPGIISRLDYIKELGVTAIWFSPLYVSPLKDYGYDISDYRNINPIFGTMQDFEELVRACHERGLKIIMDMVVNHTSDKHEWFQKAMSSKDSPYRDYYIIRQGKRNGRKLLPPTDWDSTFTGSAWERIGDSDEFYLHLFTKEQPDLNWENPKVRDEIADILRYWLDKGVDGFRFDVFNVFSKVYPLRDDPHGGLSQRGLQYYADGPRMHEYLKELNAKALSLYDSYTVGESFKPHEEDAILYVSESEHELDSLFNFAHLNSDNIGGLKFFKKRFDMKQFKEGLFDAQQKYYPVGWNTLVLENHDNPRSVCRFGINYKKYRYEAATFLATVTFMGFGIPYIYQGEEIGMTNAGFTDISQMKDPVSHFVYNMMRKYHIPKRIAFNMVNYGARDHARVPMQWDSTENAGFNTSKAPWQCMGRDYKEINVEKDLASEKSVYKYYQKLLKIKKTNPAAIGGKLIEFDRQNRYIIAYLREEGAKKLFVVGNFSDRTIEYVIPGKLGNIKFEPILCNYPGEKEMISSATLKLRPYETVIFESK